MEVILAKKAGFEGIELALDRAGAVSLESTEKELLEVRRMADENGTVVIMKNNAPRYLLIEFSQAQAMQAAADADVLAVSKRLIAKNRQAYEELAK